MTRSFGRRSRVSLPICVIAIAGIQASCGDEPFRTGDGYAGAAGTAGGTAVTGGIGGEAGGNDGGAGEAGGSGAGGGAPCEGRCGGATPICDESKARCVACLESNECSAPTPVCDPKTNTCVACVASTDCAEPKPACDAVAHVCIECASEKDCGGATPLCDSAVQKCVACLVQSDCKDAAAAQCASDESCKPCVNGTHCADIEGKPICSAGTCVECAKQSDCSLPTASQCDATSRTCAPCTTDAHCSNIAGKGVCMNGACVQCTAEKSTACRSDSASGSRYVCDSLKHTCTTQPAKSAGLCDACVSDAQCVPGELCVLDTLETATGTKSVGYFCHWKQGDTSNGAPADCFTMGRPYVHLRSTMSIDGEAANVCVLRVSSCAANADFSAKDCAPDGTPDDGLCGVASPSDAKCVPYGIGYRCTMTCGSTDDCPALSCRTNVSPTVCAL